MVKGRLIVFLFRVLTLELCLAPTQVLSKSEELGVTSSEPPPFILRYQKTESIFSVNRKTASSGVECKTADISLTIRNILKHRSPTF